MTQQFALNADFSCGGSWTLTDLPPVDDTPPAEEDDPAGPKE